MVFLKELTKAQVGTFSTWYEIKQMNDSRFAENSGQRRWQALNKWMDELEELDQNLGTSLFTPNCPWPLVRGIGEMIPQRCQDTLSKFGVGNVFALRMYRDRNANTINLNLYSLKEANTQGSALFISARRDGSLSVRNHEDEFLELVSDNPYAELFTLIFDDFRKAVWASFIQEKIKEIEEARYKRRTSISALTSHPYRAVRSIIFDQIKGEKMNKQNKSY